MISIEKKNDCHNNKRAQLTENINGKRYLKLKYNKLER